MRQSVTAFIAFICCFQLAAQDNPYQSILINPLLLENANAVVRNEVIEIEVAAVDKMIIRTSRAVTVLNEYGDKYVETYDFYDDDSKIKKQEAVVYDKMGKEVRKFKRKNFEDRSAVSSGDLISDNRVKYIDYTAREYPYTIVYESELQSNSTAFVRSWSPYSGYYLSVEKASYELKNPAGIPLRFEEKNLQGVEVEKSTSGLELSYSASNLPAYKYERLSPDLKNYAPAVLVALDEFSLVGVKGQAKDWAEFGKWQYEHLLQGKTALSPQTRAKIKSLTAGAGNDVEKAKKIYEYVQENTRYISVQLGIGGWEPMTAEEVDRVRYGDCKALTNYTKALLEAEGIPSYYAVVYGGEDRVDIDENFASMQGNHVILNIPSEEEDIWLECTSQTTPFNYLGDFTDNRNVLLIKPDGGEIVKTRAYSVEENVQESRTSVLLDETGSYKADVTRTSKGVPYGNMYHLMRETEKDQKLYYQRNWGHLKNMDFESLSFNNDRERQEFTEQLTFNGERLTSKAGSRLLLPLNFLVPYTYNLPRNEERKLPLEIARGRTYIDVFEFLLPQGFEPESIPEDVALENDFGRYELKVQLKEKEGVKLIEVQRTYVVNEGLWPAESYGGFRSFMNKINSYNNQKAVLVANN